MIWFSHTELPWKLKSWKLPRVGRSFHV